MPTEEESIYCQEVMQVVAKLDDFNGGSATGATVVLQRWFCDSERGRMHVGSVRQGRWRMLPLGCLSVMRGAPNASLSYRQ